MNAGKMRYNFIFYARDPLGAMQNFVVHTKNGKIKFLHFLFCPCVYLKSQTDCLV